MSEEKKKITTPLTDEMVEDLRTGDQVLISGAIYTARDAAHKRLVELLDKGEKLPFDVRGQIIYFVGPTPAKPGQVIGSAGPTTSYRMNAYTPRVIEAGQKGMIGKGEMGPEVVEKMKKHKAVYFSAVGGAGALIAKSITAAEIIAYEDLGAEAIRKLTVKDFPAIVALDCHGGNLYREGVAKYGKEL
ncbi:MAG: Fe-S-containing hydro-lyase [Candidatus Zixiibacteriota bacterium]|nr:MAG: Fe-S-containing hydro-lyase [candidate division Zixibacteria bacterium]